MDWSNEPYVRNYTRDTAAWLALPYQARLLFYELQRKADRAGVIKLGRRGLVTLPGLVHCPAAFVQVGISALIEEGAVQDLGDRLLLPEHLESQEAERSDKARQRDSRERRRAKALASGASADEARAASRPDRLLQAGPDFEVPEGTGVGHTGSHAVTTGHVESHGVTAGHSLLCSALPSLQDPPTAPQGGRPRSRGKAAAVTAEAKRATASVIAAYNRCFDRSLGPEGWETGVQRLLAKGYSEAEIRGVVWWASEEWADDPAMRDKVSPATLLKLQSSQGYRTFPQYLSLAAERWRDTHGGEPPPWEKPPPQTLQPTLAVGAEA